MFSDHEFGLDHATVLLISQTCASAATVVLTLVPWTIVRTFSRTGSTGEYTPVPFVTAVGNALVGTYYGIASNNQFYLLVSIFQDLVTIAFLTLFFWYSANGRKVAKLVITVMSVLAVMHAAVFFAESEEHGLTIASRYTCGINIANMAAPLANMSLVIRRKDSSSMSLPVSAMVLICSSAWLAYGLLIGDAVVWGPNAIGMGLSILQLSLFVLYPRKKELDAASKKSESELGEAASPGDDSHDLEGQEMKVMALPGVIVRCSSADRDLHTRGA